MEPTTGKTVPLALQIPVWAAFIDSLSGDIGIPSRKPKARAALSFEMLRRAEHTAFITDKQQRTATLLNAFAGHRGMKHSARANKSRVEMDIMNAAWLRLRMKIQ